jgi:hypothetical protein
MHIPNFNKSYSVAFEVVTAVNIKITVLLDVMSCRMLETGQRLEGSIAFLFRAEDGGKKFLQKCG